ncbi:MATE efflux family protein [Lichtheimia hyalospora FSU 10163]|nr:MATE efflux family protein [Lichtheimia hyalospora FSU 10163]
MSAHETIVSESSPLLEQQPRRRQQSWSEEFRWLLYNSIPLVGTYLLQNAMQIASVFSLGHLGPVELAAAALGTMFANVSAWSVVLGTATALDTFCAQAYTGARDKTLVGVYLQRSLLIMAILFIPIAVVWWYATSILLALNQDPELALKAGLFLRWFLIGAPAFMAFECCKKYMQAQGLMKPPTYAMIIAFPTSFFLNWILVHWEPVSLGFVGAPLGTAISYWVMLLVLLVYIWKVRGSEAWGGWSREALREWWPFLKLAIPGILMVCSEWWAFEIAALAASYLGTTDLAAQSIVLSTISATFTIPYGISVAASNRVGNSLGEGLSLKSKRAAYTALIFAVGFGAGNSTLLLVTRSFFGYLFTSDPNVVIRVSQILPLCALFQIADALYGVSSGVFRGMGRQHVAAWINLLAYYVVGLPIGYVITFQHGWGLAGIWSSLCFAIWLSAAGEVAFLSTINWKKEVEIARARVKFNEDDSSWM